MLDTDISIDLNVVNHLIGLVETVFFWHFLQHLFVFLKILQWNVFLREFR